MPELFPAKLENIPSNMRVLIAMNFVDDLDVMAINELASFGYLKNQLDSPSDRFAKLLIFKEKLIPPLLYTVRFSKELTANKNFNVYRKALDEIKSCLKKGESLRPYLSTQAGKLLSKDSLLLSWGIHHLHLSSIDTAGESGFVSRKPGESHLLFLRLQGNIAYLIDIVPHSAPDRFVNQRLLEIVDRNWPELHIAPKMITGNDFKSEQIKKFNAAHVNYAININGRTILPTRGVTCAGVPIEVHDSYRYLCDQLRKIEVDVRRRFNEYFPYSILTLHYHRAIQHIRLIGIEDAYFVLQDQMTLSLCHAVVPLAQKSKCF